MARRKLQVLPGGGEGDNGGGGGFDPWKFTDDREYSVEKFYLHSKNPHDHAEQMNLKLPPDQLAQIDAVVGSDQLPYESRQDFIRDAIVHRNHWLTEQRAISNPEWIEWVTIQEFLGRVEAQKRQDEARDSIVDLARLSLQATQTRADKIGFDMALERVKEASVSIAEPWAGRLRELVTQFEVGQ